MPSEPVPLPPPLAPPAPPDPMIGNGTGLSARYFNWSGYQNTTWDLVRFQVDPNVNNNWGTDSPIPGVVWQDNFGARWTGQVQAKYTDNYVFQTVSDDGVRLFVNGELVIDNFTTHSETTNSSRVLALEAGRKYTIEMAYFENTGAAVAKLKWKGDIQPEEAIPQSQLYPEAAPTPIQGAGTGLAVTYFWPDGANAKSKAGPVGNVNFAWGASSPEPGVIPNDEFSARWVGYVQPRTTGSYSFYTQSDDGVMLWVDTQAADVQIPNPNSNVRVIDNWTDHSPTVNRGASVYLEAGKRYRITMQYYENQYEATAKLGWSSQYQPFEIIPTSQLFPTTPNKVTLVAPGGTQYPFNDMDEFLPIRGSYPTSKAAIFKDVPYWRKGDGNILTLPPDVTPSIKANGGWAGVIPPGAFFGPDGCFPSVGVALIPPEPGMPTYLLHFSGADNVREGFFRVGFAWKAGLFNSTRVPAGYEAVICGGAWQSDFLDRQDTFRRLNDVVSFLRDNDVKITAYVPSSGFAVDENGWVYWTSDPPASDGDRFER